VKRFVTLELSEWLHSVFGWTDSERRLVRRRMVRQM
jgi:hypothetical protein